MKFESMHHVLRAIARCIDTANIVGNPQFKHACQISEAARDLWQQLSNAPDLRPRWVEIRYRRPMFNDRVAEEGEALLEAAAQWRDYETSRRLAFIAVESRVGKHSATPLMEPVIEENGQWTQQEFWRAASIGFDRAEVVRFLDATNIPYRF